MEAVGLVDVVQDTLVRVGQPSLLEKNKVWVVLGKKQ